MNNEGGFLGKPFFVTKERFPQPPSKKVIPDISGCISNILNAGEASGKAESSRCPLNRKRLALSQRKPIPDISGCISNIPNADEAIGKSRERLLFSAFLQ